MGEELELLASLGEAKGGSHSTASRSLSPLRDNIYFFSFFFKLIFYYVYYHIIICTFKRIEQPFIKHAVAQPLSAPLIRTLVVFIHI